MEEILTTPTVTPSRLENYSPRGPSLKKKIGLLVIILGLLLLVGGLLFARGRKGGEEVSPTPTPTLTAEPTPTLEVSPTLTPQVTPTPTAKPTPTVKSKGIKVRVLNGSGVVGAAGKVTDFLKSLGYEIVSTGNAENYNFEKTEILAKASATLLQLQTDLATKYEIGTTSATLTATESADAVVTVGKK